MNTPSLIVLDDLPIAYQYCQKLRDRCPAFRTIINVDLKYSKTIIEGREQLGNQEDLFQLKTVKNENTQTYQEVIDYLSSDKVPEDLILIVDLGFSFHPDTEKKIVDNHFNDVGGLDEIAPDQSPGLLLAIIAIKNLNIKNLLIYYATNRPYHIPAYSYLKKEANIAQKQYQAIREITMYKEAGGAFVSNKIQEKYAEDFLNEAIEKWRKLISENEQPLSLVTNNDDGAKFRIRLSGIAKENGNISQLKAEIKRLGKNKRYSIITTPSTVHYAEILCEAYVNGKFINYQEICNIYDTHKGKNQKTGQNYVTPKNQVKKVAARIVNQLDKRLKFQISFFKKGDLISEILFHEKQEGGYSLVTDVDYKIKDIDDEV